MAYHYLLSNSGGYNNDLRDRKPKEVCMTREELLNRISINPEICFGKPCIRGHRIWVSLILDFLANGASVEEVLQDYPQLEQADIVACIAYGAEMSRERCVDIPLQSKP
jgi:uncharacterized protein (DUF433 family)